MQDYALRRIVLGMDLEGLADGALRRAMELATHADAHLDVVHAVDIHPPFRGTASSPEWAAATAAAMAEAHAKLEGRLELGVETPPFAELPLGDYVTVRVGRPARVLLEFAEEHGADLIVLGPHRERRLFDFGGTARALLAHAPCPIWVQATEPEPVRRILAAIDLSPQSERVLTLARTLARVFEARVRVLHSFFEPSFAYDLDGHEPTGPTYVVDHVRDATRKAFLAQVEAFPWGEVEAETEFASGEAHAVILGQQEDHDLLVLGSHGRGALSTAILGGQAYRVLRSANRPVALVHQEVRALAPA